MLLSCRTWPLCPDRVKEPSCYWITAAQENKPKPKTSLFGLSSHLCPGGAAPSARAGADPSGIWLCPGAHSLLAGLQRSRSDLSAISRGTGDRGSPRHSPARPGPAGGAFPQSASPSGNRAPLPLLPPLSRRAQRCTIPEGQHPAAAPAVTGHRAPRVSVPGSGWAPSPRPRDLPAL